MSLKSYLRALIGTRVSASEAAHASMPAGSNVIVVSSTAGEGQRYTAPADGYFCIDSNTASVSTPPYMNYIQGDVLVLVTSERRQSLVCPVRKGNVIVYSMYQTCIAKFRYANGSL